MILLFGHAFAETGGMDPPATPTWVRRLHLAALLSTWIAAALLPSACAAQSSWEKSHPNLREGADLPSDFVLGLESSQAIAESFGLVETDSLVQRVNRVGYRVALASGRPNVIFTFQILDMDEPNAMALPGGWVFVTRGMLELGLTEAELAHLLGHEIAHVTHGDFSRQGRLDGLLSLLQTAMVVAVTLAGSSAQSTGPVIEQPGSYDYPQSSGEAALTGTAVFGSVFHELLLRGYGRKLELQADEEGRLYASLAGYPREAGASLLEKLHDRIYEDREFAYWRTHPYFTDRVRAARAASPGSDYGPTNAEVSAYRLGVQQGLASAAAAFRDESLGDYLYELALRAGTSEGSSLAVHSQLLRFRLDRMDRRDPLLRRYGPLYRDYDSLLFIAGRSGATAALLKRIEATRDSVDTLRLALLPSYLQALEGPGASTQILEIFLKNFPEHPLANTMRLRLARSYRLSARADLAAVRLGEALAYAESHRGGGGYPGRAPAAEGGAEASDSTDVQRARTELLRTLPHVTDPEVCQRLLVQLDDAELTRTIVSRMEVLADTLTSLATVGHFVQTEPSSPIAARFRKRLAVLAENEYKKGRIGEGLGDQQNALAAYNRVAILAPDTPSAAESRRGIMRIQALAATDTDR